MSHTTRLLLLLTALVACVPGPTMATTLAQPADGRLSAEDYLRAERFLSWHAGDLVYRAQVRPQWVNGESFWYRNRVPDGHEFVLVDASAATREPAFDHARLAASLGTALDTTFQPLQLPFTSFSFVDGRQAISFQARGTLWRCDLRDYQCTESRERRVGVRNAVTSPDGRLAAFIRDHDIWVRDLETGNDTRITTDGEEHYGYGTDSQGWRTGATPILLWSPDSRMIATYRLDERDVGEMHLLRTAEPRPRLQTWKYALPGDTVVPMHERVVLRVDDPGVVGLETPPDHQRTSSCCGLARADGWADVEWSQDATSLAFASVSRDYRDVVLRVADPVTGRTRTVLQERGEPFFESSTAGRGNPNWRVLHQSGQVLWFSQRDGWGHLYLYDLETGQLNSQLTSGEWNVVEVLRVDQEEGWVYFTGAGRKPDRDPYFRHLYRVSLAGSDPVLLTPEDANHEVDFSPDGRFFVDSYSRIDAAPVTVLRKTDGSKVRQVEEADVSRLLDTGWPWPRPFTVKARDGMTDLYGVMYLPSDFDPEKRYPIINSNYPGPQAGSIGSRSFTVSRRQAQALAELGFVVVQIDAMGTPGRSKEFHAAYYGDMGDNGLEDQVAGMRQLAERYPFIDLDRVGIVGHSGGGFAAAAAILRYPDFFHVAVASAGNHDNRGYTYYWGEKWQGLLEPRADGTDTYTNQANHLLAENLQGRLLLSYGTLDSNVHPNMTLLLVNELIRHNKDFDLIVMPNRGHGYANEPYHLRRTWDYFVTHLLGKEPPREYEIRRNRTDWSALDRVP